MPRPDPSRPGRPSPSSFPRRRRRLRGSEGEGGGTARAAIAPDWKRPSSASRPSSHRSSARRPAPPRRGGACAVVGQAGPPARRRGPGGGRAAGPRGRPAGRCLLPGAPLDSQRSSEPLGIPACGAKIPFLEENLHCGVRNPLTLLAKTQP